MDRTRTLLDDDFFDWQDDFIFKAVHGKKKSDSKEIEKALREWARAGRRYYYPNKKKKKKDSSGGSSGSSGFRKQRCTVKCSYEKNSKQKNLEFLKKYMPQEHKEEVLDKPRVFNGEYDVVPDEVLAGYEDIADEKFWRFIISPSRQDIPMEILVREFMRRVEAATGYRLTWFGARHTDTGKVHSHVLINGIDKDGKVVKFDRSFFKSLFRDFASDICTDCVGYRTKEDIENERKMLPYSRRWCQIDNKIKLYTVASYGNNDSEKTVASQDSQMHERLLFLVKLGIARKVDDNAVFPSRFILERNWEESLRALGNYNSFLKARSKLKYSDGSYLELYKGTTGRVAGEITQLYKLDYEDSWQNAIVIENKANGKSWFIPTRKEPNDRLLGATVEFSSHGNGKQNLGNKLKVLRWGNSIGL